MVVGIVTIYSNRPDVPEQNHRLPLRFAFALCDLDCNGNNLLKSKNQVDMNRGKGGENF